MVWWLCLKIEHSNVWKLTEINESMGGAEPTKVLFYSCCNQEIEYFRWTSMCLFLCMLQILHIKSLKNI